MAKLPSAEQLGERPTPQPQLSVVADRGAEIAAAGADAEGRALTGLGNQLQAASNEFWQFKEKTDTIRVEDAWNQYQNTAIDLTSGPNGLLNTKGADAVNGDLLGKSNATLMDARRKISEGLTDEQRQRFGQRADVTDRDTKRAVLGHLAQQQTVYSATVFSGSNDTARATVAADPVSEETYLRTKSLLMEQANLYLKQNGVTDKGTIDALRDKLTDGLFTTRIDALLSLNQPLLADKLFRDNAGDIKNPETRLVLRNKTQEAAVIMNAGMRAEVELDRSITNLIEKPPARAVPEDGPAPQGRQIDTNAPRSVRNNNPGNIEKSATKWQGEVLGADPRFVTFATPEDGMRAMQQNLLAYQDKRGLNTIQDIIARWAPAKENGEAALANYVKTVAAAVGVAPNTRIDLHDQATMQKMTAAMARVESGGQSGGMQTVALDTPPEQRTNTLPDAKDIAALKATLIAKGEKNATELYGADPTNPARFSFMKHYEASVNAKLASKVAQLNAIQKQSLDDLSDMIMGPVQGKAGMQTVAEGGNMRRVASFADLQQVPGAMQKYWQLDGEGRRAVAAQLRTNASSEDKGDPALMNDLRNRLYLPTGDPQKINTWSEIMQNPRIQGAALTPTQLNYLRADFERSQTEDGRSYGSVKKNGETFARAQFRSDPVLTNAGVDYSKADLAQMLWSQNADKVVAMYNQQNMDIRPLFDPTTKESLVSPQEVQRWKTAAGALSSGQTLKAMATDKLVEGAPAVQPAKIKTREELDTWLKTLPPTVDRFTGADGKVRLIPGRAKPAPSQGATGTF